MEGKAKEINPSEERNYSNRETIYYVKKEYTKAWDDIYKAEELGFKVNQDFLEHLKKYSGREK